MMDYQDALPNLKKLIGKRARMTKMYYKDGSKVPLDSIEGTIFCVDSRFQKGGRDSLWIGMQHGPDKWTVYSELKNITLLDDKTDLHPFQDAFSQDNLALAR